MEYALFLRGQQCRRWSIVDKNKYDDDIIVPKSKYESFAKHIKFENCCNRHVITSDGVTIFILLTSSVEDYETVRMFIHGTIIASVRLCRNRRTLYVINTAEMKIYFPYIIRPTFKLDESGGNKNNKSEMRKIKRKRVVFLQEVSNNDSPSSGMIRYPHQSCYVEVVREHAKEFLLIALMPTVSSQPPMCIIDDIDNGDGTFRQKFTRQSAGVLIPPRQTPRGFTKERIKLMCTQTVPVGKIFDESKAFYGDNKLENIALS